MQERYREDHILERSPFLNTEFLLFNAEAQIPYELRWAINAGIDRIQMMKLLEAVSVGPPVEESYPLVCQDTMSVLVLSTSQTVCKRCLNLSESCRN